MLQHSQSPGCTGGLLRNGLIVTTTGHLRERLVDDSPSALLRTGISGQTIELLGSTRNDSARSHTDPELSGISATQRRDYPPRFILARSEIACKLDVTLRALPEFLKEIVNNSLLVVLRFPVPLLLSIAIV